MPRLFFISIAFVCLCALCGSGRAEAPDGVEWPVVFKEDFSAPTSVERWEFADPSAWRLASGEGFPFLSTFKDSAHKPPVRSPENIAWIKDLEVGSFVLDATARSTEREYGHRDVCVLFGRQDPAHFYYVHLATKADEHAHSIFLVNGEPRVSIAQARTDGVAWNESWHHIRVVRNVQAGDIVVFFDNMDTPIMRAVDTHFAKGRVGFGSFDDTVDLREIVIRGE
ncbi:MAG: hypothetical protein GHCLOJNM_01722 [bacterium]|nr:hypothetical protein [bacterium]